MRVKKMWFLFIALGVLLFSGFGVANTDLRPEGINQIPSIPDVVARVNGSDILAQRIKFQFKQVLKNARAPMTSPQKDKILRKVIDQEVVRELMHQEAQKLKLTIDSNVIDTEFKALKSAYKNEDEFKKALLQRGIVEDDLKKAIEVDAQAQMIIKQQVQGNVEIDEADVQKYFQDNKENFLRPAAFRVSHILVMPFSPEMIKNTKIEDLQDRKEELRQKAKEKILGIQKELKNGAKIVDLAKKYSHDESTAQNGGDLGFFYADGVEKVFSDAVSKLEVGEVSDVVETTFGFHLIELTETKPSEYAPFEDMKEAIQKHLFMKDASNRVADYITDLRKKAEIEIFY